MIRTESPVAREELERLVHEYRHVRDEHRHARRGGRRRRRLGAQLHELDTRFERVLATIPVEDATRREWRDHLHKHAAAPSAPPGETPLPLQQGASVHWPAPAGETPVAVHLRGDLPAHAREDLRRTLSGLARLTPRPLLHARGSLERLPDPALARPVIAKASLDLGAHAVRARISAATAAEAVDLLSARLRRNLLELGDREEAARRESVAEGPALRPRPSGGLVRRTSFAAGRMTPEEAAWEMRQLGEEFHLFTDETGEDALVHLHEDETLGLKRIGGGGAYVDPFLVDPEPAPTLTPGEAIDLLEASGGRLLFFVERETGRGAVLYRRRDGDHGLVTMRDELPLALRLACAQCGRLLPDDARLVAGWRYGDLALAHELDDVSAGMLLCPSCAAEATRGGYDAGEGD